MQEELRVADGGAEMMDVMPMLAGDGRGAGDDWSSNGPESRYFAKKRGLKFLTDLRDLKGEKPPVCQPKTIK